MSDFNRPLTWRGKVIFTWEMWREEGTRASSGAESKEQNSRRRTDSQVLRCFALKYQLFFRQCFELTGLSSGHKNNSWIKCRFRIGIIYSVASLLFICYSGKCALIFPQHGCACLRCTPGGAGRFSAQPGEWRHQPGGERRRVGSRGEELSVQRAVDAQGQQPEESPEADHRAGGERWGGSLVCWTDRSRITSLFFLFSSLQLALCRFGAVMSLKIIVRLCWLCLPQW